MKNNIDSIARSAANEGLEEKSKERIKKMLETEEQLLEYQAWKEKVPRQVRDIVEGSIKGEGTDFERTGLVYVDDFLQELSGLSGGTEKKNILERQLDEKVANALSLLQSVQSNEGAMDAISMLTSPDVSWHLKNSLYRTHLEPLLEWLADESLKKEIEQHDNPPDTPRDQDPSPEKDRGGEGGADSGDVPPTTEEAISSMEHGVEQGAENGKPFFSVRSFWGGYYKQHLYDMWDPKVCRWGKSQKHTFSKIEHDPSLEPTSKRVLFGKVRGGESPLAIPLPYDWSVEKGSIIINAPKDSYDLKQNQDGIWYLGVKDEGVFQYQVTIGRDIAAVDKRAENDTEISGALPPDITHKIEELQSSSLPLLSKARALVRFVRDHLEYSNDPDAYKSYIAKPDAYFVSLWSDKRADCYVSNTLAVRSLREMGVQARFVGGFFCKEKNDDGSAALGGSNGHAWLEVWDVVGKRWQRMDATPKGDPAMNEDQQEQDLEDEAQDGDYGENESEIMSEDELKKKIDEMKKKKGGGGRKGEKSLSDMEDMRFAEEAGCTESEARVFHEALERVREIRNEQGESISELLKEEWRKIVEEHIIELPTYKGPVRMREGDRLEEVVDAYIDVASGETNPTGYEKEFQVEKIKQDFGGINIYFSFDLSYSMTETDVVSGRSKKEVQADIALLFADSLMQAAMISERASEGGDDILPIKLMVVLTSTPGVPALPLTAKWGPREQWAFYSGVKKTASGSTPTAETLKSIQREYKKEQERLKKEHTPQDKYPLEYTIELTDGEPDDVEATKKIHQELIQDGIVVRSLVVGGVPIDETGMYNEEGGPLESFSQIPQILAKDIVEQFQKLRPEKIQ